LSSEAAAEEMSERLRPILRRNFLASKRGYWLDLAVRSSQDTLGIDLFDSLSTKYAVDKFVERAAVYLNKLRESDRKSED